MFSLVRCLCLLKIHAYFIVYKVVFLLFAFTCSKLKNQNTVVLYFLKGYFKCVIQCNAINRLYYYTNWIASMN